MIPIELPAGTTTDQSDEDYWDLDDDDWFLEFVNGKKASKVEDEFAKVEQLLADDTFWTKYQDTLIDAAEPMFRRVWEAGSRAGARIIFNNQEFDEEFKHYPGGKDHDQSTHSGQHRGNVGGVLVTGADETVSDRFPFPKAPLLREFAAATDFEADQARAEEAIEAMDFDLPPTFSPTGAAKAVSDYTGAGYRDINSVLRHGKTEIERDEAGSHPFAPPQEDVKRMALRKADDIDSFMKPLPQEVVLWRGGKDFGLEMGDTFTDKGFVSSSTNPNQAVAFVSEWNNAPEERAIYRIHTPKGTKVLQPPDYHGESEVIIGRNTEFAVVDKTHGHQLPKDVTQGSPLEFTYGVPIYEVVALQE